jgi:uncharacterized cupin superfamily protein
VPGEARIDPSPAGLVAATPGWFVVNVRDAAWVTDATFGDACIIEGDAVTFNQMGYTIAVLQPGQANGLYHRESNQEDFLVLAGRCLLLVEEEERPLQAWDFVHCPPGTAHIFVGAGDGPCVIFMAGARTAPKDTVYVHSELALHHRAGVAVETGSPREAYAPYPRWRPGPPADWDGLPWALR